MVSQNDWPPIEVIKESFHMNPVLGTQNKYIDPVLNMTKNQVVFVFFLVGTNYIINYL